MVISKQTVGQLSLLSVCWIISTVWCLTLSI